MDTVIMGKIIGHNKTVVLLVLITMLSLVSTMSMAALQEDDLFVKAYDYYLSYHPEKALEYFDNFLRNFPDSSAKDAALFWKAKSLMQLNKAEEAEKIFSQLKAEVPGSPFVPFIDKELAAYKNSPSGHFSNEPTNDKKSITAETSEIAGKDKISELKKEKENLEKKLTEINELKQLTEKGLSKAIEDNNRLEGLLKDSRKNNEDLSRKIADNNQIEADIKNLRSERDELKKRINELKEKNEEAKRLSTKADEQEKLYAKTVALLQQLKDGKEALEKGAGEKDKKISELNEKIKKVEKEKELEKQDKQNRLKDLNRLSSEKDDQESKQGGIATKEKETLAAKLKEAEKTVGTTTASMQSLNSDYESLKKKYAALADREKNALQEVSLLKEKTSQYEAPVVAIGRNQFSVKQIIDDARVSSDVLVKIGATNIPWRYDDPYNNFILEQALLMTADNNRIKEDKAVLKSFLERYSLDESEIKYLVTFLTINNLLKKKLGEIVGDEKYIRKYYEMNKGTYRINTSGRRVKGLSIMFSPQDEMEKSLLALDLLQEVVGGKTFEMVMKENPGVLAVGPVNVSELPIFIRDKMVRLKEGEISNVISYDSKVAFFQLESGKQEFRTFEDVYREIREKVYKDQTLQARLLREWFHELNGEVKVLKQGLSANEIKR